MPGEEKYRILSSKTNSQDEENYEDDYPDARIVHQVRDGFRSPWRDETPSSLYGGITFLSGEDFDKEEKKYVYNSRCSL